MLKDVYQVFKDAKHGIYQIRCKDDFFTVEFYDEDEKQIFLDSVDLLQAEKADVDQILTHLYETYPKEKVNSVIEELENLDLLAEKALRDRFSDHVKEQLNFWSYSKSPRSPSALQMQERIENTKLGIFGAPFNAQLISQKARMSGFVDVHVEDISTSPGKEHILSQIEALDFFIVDAEKWNPEILEKINQQAVTNSIPWLYIQGCSPVSASIGPLFVGGQTGCYHCLMTRIKSNMEFVPHFEEFEKYLVNGKKSSTCCGAPIPMYDFLASISILETIKYITEWSVPALYKSVITIDYYSLITTHHKLLKVPTCPICVPDQDHLQAPWLEPVTLT